MSAIPADLDAQVHQMIISGEFRAWRRRNPTIRTNGDNGEPPSENRNRRAKCTFPNCNQYYVISPKKPNTLCGKHSRLESYHRNREITMTKCAFENCTRWVRHNGNSTGKCRIHATRAGTQIQRAGRKVGYTVSRKPNMEANAEARQ